MLNVETDKDALSYIAGCSRKTPRVANRLLKRVRDYAQVKHQGRITQSAAEEALKMLEVDEIGLEPTDRQILKIMMDRFNGGPVGLQALAAGTFEEVDTIEEVYEPYLLQIGFIERTPRGRVATPAAYKHLNIPPPKQENTLL